MENGEEGSEADRGDIWLLFGTFDDEICSAVGAADDAICWLVMVASDEASPPDGNSVELLRTLI